MARVSTYLNFPGNTREAIAYYGQVFGTEPVSMMSMSDIPADPDMPPLPENERNAVMHVELPILAGHALMATDMLESMGHKLAIGNNTTIALEIDTRAEADRLYAALSDGATDCAPLDDMFWGAYWGTCLDRFGIRWMFNCYEPKPEA